MTTKTATRDKNHWRQSVEVVKAVILAVIIVGGLVLMVAIPLSMNGKPPF